MVQLEYRIPERWRGQTISSLLRKELGFSALRLKSLREAAGSVRLDGQAVPFYHRPATEATLTIFLPEDPPSPIPPVEGPLDVLYEDEHLVVLNKAPGVTVHPGPGHHGDTVGNFLTWHYRQQSEDHWFRPVNRLDKGTSGLMCVAKHAYAAERLGAALHSPDFVRSYLAVCDGAPCPRSGAVDAPIGRKDGSVLQREVRADGKAAVTAYQTLSGKNGRYLVRLQPKTGRTHQIRVHMAYLGCPLTGDFLYGTERPELIRRPALHSADLCFRHPISGKTLSFSAPLPEDMRLLLL